MFVPNVILDPLNVCANLKKPAADSPSLFDDLFFIQKSIKVNSIDNKILLQVVEKVKALTKVSFEQLEYIKQLEEKIKKLTNNTKKISKRATVSLGEIMASQVAKFAATNRVIGHQTSPATPGLPSIKLATGPKLIIDFT